MIQDGGLYREGHRDSGVLTSFKAHDIDWLGRLWCTLGGLCRRSSGTREFLILRRRKDGREVIAIRPSEPGEQRWNEWSVAVRSCQFANKLYSEPL